jgi:hypothetical protein
MTGKSFGLISLVLILVLGILFPLLSPLGVFAFFCFPFGTDTKFRKWITRSIRLGGLLGSVIIPIAIWEKAFGFNGPAWPLYVLAIPNMLLIWGFAGGLIGAFVYPLHDLFTHVAGDPPPEPGHINASAIAQWTKLH